MNYENLSLLDYQLTPEEQGESGEAAVPAARRVNQHLLAWHHAKSDLCLKLISRLVTAGINSSQSGLNKPALREMRIREIGRLQKMRNAAHFAIKENS